MCAISKSLAQMKAAGGAGKLTCPKAMLGDAAATMHLDRTLYT